jgi:uncharacterized protein with beta-barrel porin domain
LSVANTYTGNTTVSSGTLLVNGSTSTGAVTVNGGTLGGTGTIGGAVTVNSGGTLAPGSGGIGALTVNGNITLNAGSTNAFEVNGSTPANDVVAAGGTVTYGGVLNIVPTGTFTNGQTFTLFSGGGAVNPSNYASIQSGSPILTFGFTNGVLRVVNVVNTTPTNITLTTVVNIFGTQINLSWPPDHKGWRLQTQTNALSVGIGTNWVDVPGSTSNTTMIIGANPTNGAVFYRLVFP